MKVCVTCIRDVLIGFGNPMFSLNEAVAKRDFASMVNDDNRNAQVSFAPSDFELYKLGTFDTETGHFDLEELPQLLVRGNQVFNG